MKENSNTLPEIISPTSAVSKRGKNIFKIEAQPKTVYNKFLREILPAEKSKSNLIINPDSTIDFQRTENNNFPSSTRTIHERRQHMKLSLQIFSSSNNQSTARVTNPEKPLHVQNTDTHSFRCFPDGTKLKSSSTEAGDIDSFSNNDKVSFRKTLHKKAMSGGGREYFRRTLSVPHADKNVVLQGRISKSPRDTLVEFTSKAGEPVVTNTQTKDFITLEGILLSKLSERSANFYGSRDISHLSDNPLLKIRESQVQVRQSKAEYIKFEQDNTRFIEDSLSRISNPFVLEVKGSDSIRERKDHRSSLLENHILKSLNFLEISGGSFQKSTPSVEEIRSLRTTMGNGLLSPILQRRRSSVSSEKRDPLADEWSTENLVQSLKKELPNLQTDHPSGRNETLILGNWLAKKLQELQLTNVLSVKAKLGKGDELYNLCLNELLRQISLDCFERADLLKKIWKAYGTLFDEVIESIKIEQQTAIAKYADECRSIHENYKKELDKKDQEIEQLKEKSKEFSELYEKGLKTLAIHNFNETRLEDELARTKNTLREIKRQYGIMKREYEDMYFKYWKMKKDCEEAEVDDDEEELDPQEFIIQKFKNKTSGEPLGSYIEIDEPKQDENIGSFGTFKGVKIVWEDKEVQTEEIPSQDVEVQTDIKVLDRRFDVIFDGMLTIEELVREENLKRTLQFEIPENMEEDLYAEILDNSAANTRSGNESPSLNLAQNYVDEEDEYENDSESEPKVNKETITQEKGRPDSLLSIDTRKSSNVKPTLSRMQTDFLQQNLSPIEIERKKTFNFHWQLNYLIVS